MPTLCRLISKLALKNGNFERAVSSSFSNLSKYISTSARSDTSSSSCWKFNGNSTISRSLTTLSQAAAGTAVSKDEKREFMAVFPDIVRDLTDAGRHLDIPEATKWYAKVLQYNVPGGKKNRGMALVLGYKHLAKSNDLTPENTRLAHILGWCVELLQGAFLVLDDIIDESSTRRGRPCWYKTPGVGLKAINDGNLLESGVFQLLRRHFKSRSYYIDIIELFHDVSLKTKMGQALDLLGAQPNHIVDLDNLTMDRYNSIVKYKTAYYSFHLPIALAMHMAGINDEERHRQAKTILLEMGHFFQVQDDFMDCFGNPEVTGKVGTDIQEGKCSWLVVVALQRAASEQRQLLKECYGSSDPEKVRKVKTLYEELALPATFSTYEEESYNLIKTHIQQISAGLSHDLFFKLLEKIYRREN